MGEDQNKSASADFEESLRQILNSAPSGGQATVRGGQSRPSVRPEDIAPEAADKAEPRALFWFKLLRPVGLAALLAFLVIFVMRITAAR